MTTLQLAQAYSVLANRGVKRPVSLLRQQQNLAPSEQVADDTLIDSVVNMLTTVVGLRVQPACQA